MRIGRLGAGELLTGVAAVGLLLLLALDWFSADEGPALGPGAVGYAPLDVSTSGYGALGIVLVVLLVIVALLGIALVVLTLRGRPVAWPIGTAVLCSFIGILVWPVLALRVLVLGPGDLDVTLAGWLGVLAGGLIPLGSWLAMADERKGAPESAYVPPPARPVPGSTPT